MSFKSMIKYIFTSYEYCYKCHERKEQKEFFSEYPTCLGYICYLYKECKLCRGDRKTTWRDLR